MTVLLTETLPELYLRDETAWLDLMAETARDGRVTELDLQNLAEYLSDMATRDRREVNSRLVVLLAHHLKWDYQPEKRSRSWRTTLIVQQYELIDWAASGVLRNHAESMLPEVYERAVKEAASETSLPIKTFPAVCPYTIEQLLNEEIHSDEPLEESSES